MTAIDRLSPDDLMILHSGGRWPQIIGALVILERGPLLHGGAFRIDEARSAIEARLGAVPRFRQVLVMPRRGLGGPFWADDQGFDVRDHVRVETLAPESGEPELLATIEELRRAPLDMTRPLWDMRFLTGPSEGRVGLFIRVHHAVADGMAAMMSLVALLADSAGPSAGPGAAWSPAPPPGTATLVVDSLRRRLDGLTDIGRAVLRPRATLRAVGDALPAMRELMAERPASETSLNRFVGADRRLAVLSVPAGTLREIGRANHATPNDVLLAITAGGIRSVLESRGELAADTIVRLYVPVSLRRGAIRRRGRPAGNLISQMAVPVAIGGTDPERRIRRIAAETAMRRRRRRMALGRWFRAGPVTRLLLKAIVAQRVNVTTASLRGPRSPIDAFGARVREVYPVLPIIGNVTLGVGAVSYADSVGIGVAADRETYPDIDVLVAGMRAEVQALLGSAEAHEAPGATEAA